MSQISSAQPRRVNMFIAFPVLALVLGGIVLALFLQTRVTTPADGVPINHEFEAKYGVRFTMVAMTADGGLIDVRYTVIDPGKAQAMMNSVDTLPALVRTDTGADFRLNRPMSHKNELVAGQSNYILYVNKKGALHSADRVAITVGDMRVEPLVVK